MSFRLRQTLVTALAVALAIAAASAIVYVLVRSELRGQVDATLRERAAVLARQPPGVGLGGFDVPRRGPLGFGGDIVVQAVAADGRVERADNEQVELPVTEETLEVARGVRGPFYADATVSGTSVRLFTVPGPSGLAFQLARPLDEVDSVLGRIQTIMIFVALGGIGVAAILGALVASSALRPVQRLTREAEVVAETQDLAHRIEVHGTDELSRLGTSFNTMLGALEESHRAQRQLVADASHELGTPLTSLRTNVEVLARRQDLTAEQREALLRDLTGQLEEMSQLVRNLVELSSEQPPELEQMDVQLDVLVEEAVRRAERLAPQVVFRTALEESVVRGVPTRLERAVANVLDNAVKWSEPGGEIDVRVARGEVGVRDHGPGIDEADLPHVFDRFYRAPAARPLPGSGLGLAIVRQVVEEHGGTVAVEQPDGGGTLVRIRLPDVTPTTG